MTSSGCFYVLVMVDAVAECGRHMPATGAQQAPVLQGWTA